MPCSTRAGADGQEVCNVGVQYRNPTEAYPSPSIARLETAR